MLFQSDVISSGSTYIRQCLCELSLLFSRDSGRVNVMPAFGRRAMDKIPSGITGDVRRIRGWQCSATAVCSLSTIVDFGICYFR